MQYSRREDTKNYLENGKMIFPDICQQTKVLKYNGD